MACRAVLRIPRDPGSHAGWEASAQRAVREGCTLGPWQDVAVLRAMPARREQAFFEDLMYFCVSDLIPCYLERFRAYLTHFI